MKKIKEAVMNKLENLRGMKLKTIILLLAFLSIGYLILVVSLYAAVPQRINYQGKLLDNLGAPVTDGSRNITFRIFNVSVGGAALWSETQSVSTQDGLFNVILGSVAAISLDFNQDYWLEVQVSGDGAMTPRHRLVSTPYSFRAEDANNSEQLNSQSAGYYLDAGNINSGTLNDAWLSANVTLLGSSIDASEITTNIVSSIEGVTNDGGNIDLVAGTNITITPNDAANTITIAVSGGDGVIVGGGADSTATTTMVTFFTTLLETFGTINCVRLRYPGSGAWIRWHANIQGSYTNGVVDSTTTTAEFAVPANGTVELCLHTSTAGPQGKGMKISIWQTGSNCVEVLGIKRE